ncbi:hypothetical protein OUZ56_008521 [Daphnia magna]|uniref:Uncharacterized protein n=2 Tax=Daphnia magna TaxID=35525 RepID=A0ABR0AD94_9CRUS|nr:hypothetical protein OUZ56_008521 [Daphnia magna]
MEFYSGQKISGVSAREKTDSMTYNNSSVPIMAEVTILTTNTSKRQQDLLATALAGSITRPMSTSSSLVDSSRLIADDQHFVGESTNNQQHDMIISGSIKHYGEHDCAGGARAYSAASANHPTEKTYCYSDEEGDEDEEGDDDVLASGNRLSRRHSSAGIVPLSLRSTSSSSNAIDTDVLLATDGRAGVSRSASRRCRIDEEQRNQSTIAIARPALINNNVGNWLNVPGAPVDIGKKTMKKKNNAFTSIEQQMERLELVQTPALVVGAAAASMRNQSHSQRHHHQQNHRSSNCVESSQLLVRHQQSSQHVRSQSVRVAPSGSKFAPTAPNRNNNTSPINQQQHKLIFDYNTSSSIQQQSIGKVRPRGTSLPGTNRAIALADVGITTGINADEVAAQQQQQYCDKREDDEADYYLLRHFIVHGKSNKVVNRGDSFRRSLRAHPKQQNSSAVSQHSSTSSISTENVAGSPPPIQPQQQPYHYHPQQQKQGQYYSPYQHYGLTDQVQQQQSSRRASLSLLMVAGADQQQQAGPSPPSGGPSLGEPFRVLMLGASGVGKTALTAQFMTSEYLNTYEASLDEDTCDRSVSVLLDGEESQLVFIDHPHGEISVENSVSTYNPHAFVIVYSVVDAESLREVEEVLHFLWRHSLTNNRNCNSSTSSMTNSFYGRQRHQTASATTLSTTDAPIDQTSPVRIAPLQMLPPPIVILVANKIDLVRSRIISPQAGKSLATSFDCKYIETSSGMQHNVDELLVGILKQIRLKIQKTEQMYQQQLTSPNSSTSSSKSLFRKRSGRRRQQQQQQQQHLVNYQTTGLSGISAEGEGSCCISTSAIPGIATNNAGRITMTSSTTNRRSASLRVRRMLGKAVWTCAEYYHRNKSRSCEDLHVL